MISFTFSDSTGTIETQTNINSPQCCGSALVSNFLCGSGSSPDPDPGFDDKKLKKLCFIRTCGTGSNYGTNALPWLIDFKMRYFVCYQNCFYFKLNYFACYQRASRNAALPFEMPYISQKKY
jgi:hypothetical protein